MPLFLIPAAAVGYKIWENRQKQKKGEGEEDRETNEPSLVVDSLPSDSAEKFEGPDGDVTKATTDEITELDMIDSNLSSDDDDQTRSTVNEEPNGLFGIRHFFEDKIQEHRARELQKQKNRELAMRIARGEVPMAMPKISFK